MSTGGETGAPRRRVPAWVTVIVVVVVVLLAGLVAVLTGRDQDPSQAGGSPSPTMPVPAPPEVPAATGLRVTAGAGGKEKAADGRTPIRYPKTCEGAVAAATNYYTLTMGAYRQPDLDVETYTATLSEILAGPGEDLAGGLIDDLVTAQTMKLPAEITITNHAFHPEWGAFSTTCTDTALSGTVTVDILGYVIADEWAPGANAATVGVAWVDDGKREDWRLVQLKDFEQDDMPKGVFQVGALASPPTTAERRAWIAASDDGWTEYTNAP